jgi:hypothetical protein
MNLWGGWSVKPAPGKWPKLRWHVEHILSGGIPAMADCILKWTAFGYQFVERKRGVTAVIVGGDFASKLEAAIKRSDEERKQQKSEGAVERSAKVLDLKAEEGL